MARQERRKLAWTDEQLGEGFARSATDAWQRPLQPGYFEGIKSYTTVASPFLAGFAFAAITLLIALEDPPPLTDAAIFCFVLATLGFLYALQFGAWLQVYVSPPSVRLDWHREAATDPERFHQERLQHAAELAVANRYVSRVGVFFDCGLIAFLMGIAFLVVPHRWSVLRILTMTPLGLVLALEVYGVLGRMTKGRVPSLWEPDVDEVQTNLDLPEPSTAARSAMGFPPQR